MYLQRIDTTTKICSLALTGRLPGRWTRPPDSSLSLRPYDGAPALRSSSVVASAGGPHAFDSPTTSPHMKPWGPPPSGVPAAPHSCLSSPGGSSVQERPPPMPARGGRHVFAGRSTHTVVCCGTRVRSCRRQQPPRYSTDVAIRSRSITKAQNMFVDYFNFLSGRAFNAGAAAYRAGWTRHAPAHFGTYSGVWVDGWDEAYLSDNTVAQDEFAVCY